MTRAFVAVRLPTAVLDAVAERVARLEVPGGRLMTREQWHLTLQFLGNDVDVDTVAGALRGLDVHGDRVQLGVGGAFPSARRGRVLWLGVREGNEMLSRLARAVGARLAPLGYEAETRAFRGHVTLARCQRPNDLRGPVESIGTESVGPAFDVGAVTVYESRLEREGARYVERATIELTGGLPG